jgi:hypothetical protein
MCGLQERVEPNKKNRRQSPRKRRGLIKRRPRASPTGRPAPSLRPESTVESGFESVARHEGVLPGRGFRRGFSDGSRSLPPWPGAVHAPRGSLRGPGEHGAGQHQALGAATGVPEPVLSSTATWDCWRGRPTFVGKARSGPDNGQTNRWREPGSHPSSLKRRNGVQFTNRE